MITLTPPHIEPKEIEDYLSGVIAPDHKHMISSIASEILSEILVIHCEVSGNAELPYRYYAGILNAGRRYHKVSWRRLNKIQRREAIFNYAAANGWKGLGL